MSDHAYLKPQDLDRLGEVVLELAQQLHVERARRIALERALVEKGLLDPAAVEAAAGTTATQEASRRELDSSIERILRIMTASGGPEGPLR